MRRHAVLTIALILLGGSSRDAQAQFTALTVSGPAGPMTVNTAVGGAAPTPAVNSVTTYFVKAKNPAGAQKIIAQINAPMPAGTTLSIAMLPPAGATSLGSVILDVTPKDIVINVDHVNGETQGITYTFTATIAAGVVPAQSRIVTLSIVPYP